MQKYDSLCTWINTLSSSFHPTQWPAQTCCLVYLWYDRKQINARMRTKLETTEARIRGELNRQAPNCRSQKRDTGLPFVRCLFFFRINIKFLSFTFLHFYVNSWFFIQETDRNQNKYVNGGCVRKYNYLYP